MSAWENEKDRRARAERERAEKARREIEEAARKAAEAGMAARTVGVGPDIQLRRQGQRPVGIQRQADRSDHPALPFAAADPVGPDRGGDEGLQGDRHAVAAEGRRGRAGAYVIRAVQGNELQLDHP